MLALAVVAGCWTGNPSTSTGTKPHGPQIRTCAIDPPVRTPQQLVVRRWLGRIGDRSWLIAQSGGKLALVGLAGDRLVTTELGFDILRADYVAGTHLWLAGTTGSGTVLVDVDLSGTEPRASAPIAWNITPLPSVDSVAVGSERVLLAERGIGQLAFQLFDRAQRAIGPVVTVKSNELTPPALRCSGERCFAIAITGDGPARRVFVDRFAPDGTTEHELLADDHIAGLQVVPLGDRTIAVWTAVDKSGLFARAVDATGRPGTRRVVFSGLPAPPISFEILTASPLRIAIKDINDTWSVGSLDIDAQRVDDVRTMPLARDAYAFTGAVISDGIVGAGFSSRVDYQRGIHGWTAKATAVFLPATRDAEPPIEVLPKQVGEGRSGMAAFPLVAPGHAAVLVVPQGPEAPPGGELFVLRRPCR